MKLTTMAEYIEMKVWMAHGSWSVSEVYLMRDTAVSEAFLQRRKKPHIVPVASLALASLICPPPRLLSPRLVHREH